MEAESLKMVMLVLGGVVAIAGFMRSGFSQLRGEMQANREEFRGELHGLAARQREDYDRLSDKLAEVAAQQRKDYDRLSDKYDRLSDKLTEVAAQQRKDYDRLSDKYDQLSDKLAVTAERAVRIEGMLLRQLRQERQSQAVDSPTNVVEQKPAQPRLQAKAAQATPRS